MAFGELAFPEMHAGADLEPELPDSEGGVGCEVDGPRRLAEQHEQPIPGSVDLPAAALLQ